MLHAAVSCGDMEVDVVVTGSSSTVWQVGLDVCLCDMHVCELYPWYRRILGRGNVLKIEKDNSYYSNEASMVSLKI